MLLVLLISKAWVALYRTKNHDDIPKTENVLKHLRQIRLQTQFSTKTTRHKNKIEILYKPRQAIIPYFYKMMNGNNDNDKYNSSSNSSMEMSLASLIGQVHRHSESSSTSPSLLQSLPPATYLSHSRQRRDRIDSLQDILEQALAQLSSDNNDALALPRSRRNHQNRSRHSAQPDSGQARANSQ
jgi:hypothetical protein